MALVHLMVEPDQRVPVGAVFGAREIQRRASWEYTRAVRVVDLPLEAEEELRPVPDAIWRLEPPSAEDVLAAIHRSGPTLVAVPALVGGEDYTPGSRETVANKFGYIGVRSLNATAQILLRHLMLVVSGRGDSAVT